MNLAIAVQDLNDNNFDNLESFIHSAVQVQDIFVDANKRLEFSEYTGVPIESVNYILSGYDKDVAAAVSKARFAARHGSEARFKVMESMYELATGEHDLHIRKPSPAAAVSAAKALTGMFGENINDEQHSSSIQVNIQQVNQTATIEGNSVAQVESGQQVGGWTPPRRGGLPSTGSATTYKKSLTNKPPETEDDFSVSELDPTPELTI